MDTPSQDLLSVQNLRVDFTIDGHPVPVVRGISYVLPKGRVLAVVGESGSGKTVHALSILGLLPPGAVVSGGQILYKGQNLLHLPAEKLRQIRGNNISMIFQDPMSSLNPVIPIGKQVAQTVLAHRKVSPLRARILAERLLKKVGIENPRQRYNDYPFQFSGGMCQRVMIAMALVLRPDVLIADEPTTALDVTIQAQILKLIKKLQTENGLCALFITHNLALVADIADDVFVLYAGQCMEKAPVEALFKTPLHPYTQGLLASLVSIKNKQDVLPAIAGQPPLPGECKQGCPFAPRCPKAFDRCFNEEPPLLQQGASQVKCWLWEGK